MQKYKLFLIQARKRGENEIGEQTTQTIVWYNVPISSLVVSYTNYHPYGF